MKMLLVLAFVFIGAMLLKPGCSNEQALKDCVLVCGDVGFAPGDTVKTGIFNYTCKCKRRPLKPLQIYPPR